MKKSSRGLAVVFRSRMLRSAMVASLALAPSISSAGLFGPSTYEECIAESMRGVQSDVAARAIIGICRKQFPSPQAEKAISPPTIQSLQALPQEAIDRLQAQFEYQNELTGAHLGELYNGNSDWHLRKLIVLVSPEPEKNKKAQVPTTYSINVDVAPLTKGPLTLSAYLDEGARFQWGIVSAQGWKVAQ